MCRLRGRLALRTSFRFRDNETTAPFMDDSKHPALHPVLPAVSALRPPFAAGSRRLGAAQVEDLDVAVGLHLDDSPRPSMPMSTPGWPLCSRDDDSSPSPGHHLDVGVATRRLDDAGQQDVVRRLGVDDGGDGAARRHRRSAGPARPAAAAHRRLAVHRCRGHPRGSACPRTGRRRREAVAQVVAAEAARAEAAAAEAAALQPPPPPPICAHSALKSSPGLL